MLLEITLLGCQDENSNILLDNSCDFDGVVSEGCSRSRCTIDLDRVYSVVDVGDCINIHLCDEEIYITDSFTYEEFVSKWKKNQEDQIF
jgi:hypothetical protein